MESVVVAQSGEKSSRRGPRSRPKPIYQCAHCGKVFRRREHCTRHERGHSNERPFQCNFCGRQFSRQDLIARHQKSFHPLDLAKARQQSSTDPAPVSNAQCLSQPPNKSSMGRHGQYSGDFEHVQVMALENASVEVISPGMDMNEYLSLVSINAERGKTTPDGTVIDQGLEFSLVDPGRPANQSQSQLDSSHTAYEVTEADEVADGLSNDITIDNSDVQLLHEAVDQTEQPPRASMKTSEAEPRAVDFFSMLSNDTGNPDLGSGETFYAFESEFGMNIENDMFVGQWEATKAMSSIPTPGISPSSSIANGSSTNSSTTSTRLPNLANHIPRKWPTFSVDSLTHSLLTEDIRRRLTSEQFQRFKMPSAKSINSYITTYLRSFHPHFPIIHIPHLILADTPSPYIICMCAIGALYRLERQTAKHLWFWAGVMVELEPTSPEDTKVETVGYLQCRLMLTLFAVFSGDLTADAMSKIGFWITEYRLRRTIFMSHSPTQEILTWQDWSVREASKRLLFGIYIMSSLMTVTYGVPPICSVTQDIEIEMPEHENIWEAATAEQWKELVERKKAPLMTVRTAMQQLLFGKEIVGDPQNDHTKWSVFATSVVMHAVNVHMWNVMQCTQSFNIFAVDGYMNTELKRPLMAQIETALGRCHSLLTNDSSEREFSSDDVEGPLIFNCLALLRSAYVRVFTGAGAFDRIILLRSDDVHITNAVRIFVRESQERNAFLTKAVGKAYGAFLTPIKAGYLLTRKTAALNWSVEHAVSGWDCSLFVTKWIHSLEMQQRDHPPDEEEMQNLLNFRELVVEVDGDVCEKGSLAAQVAKIWATFFDDTWVWGVTPRMGNVLRKLSSVYTEEWDAAFPPGNPRGPISF